MWFVKGSQFSAQAVLPVSFAQLMSACQQSHPLRLLHCFLICRSFYRFKSPYQIYLSAGVLPDKARRI